MPKYSLNSDNLSKLAKFLGVSASSIYEALGMPVSTGHERFKAGNLTCAQIIKISNTYKVPLRCFIMVDGDGCELERVEDWDPIHDSLYLFPDIVQMDRSVVDVINTLGISTATWFRHADPPMQFAEKTLMRDFLKWCDTLEVNAGTFLGDDNAGIPMVEEYTVTPQIGDLLRHYRKVVRENTQLKRDNNRFRQVINALRSLVHLLDDSPGSFKGKSIVDKAIIKIKAGDEDFRSFAAEDDI